MKRSLLGCTLLLLLLSLAGCQNFKLWGKTESVKDEEDEDPTKTSMIGDKVTIAGLHPILIEGVGLVTGLDNTGEDPPPSMWRTMLMEDLKKRGIKNPNAMLQSPRTALVLIRAAVPPVIQHGDRFDIEVVLPEGSSSTSLAGGTLMTADLAERAIVPGRSPASGHVLAKCQGPVLLSTGEAEKASLPSLMKRGKVLGGAVYLGGILKEDRKIGLYLRNDLKSIRLARRIEACIGNRFHNHEKGIKKSLATAKTDQHIELKIHPRYKENYIRYVQVIRHMALSETPLEQRRRIEKLRKQLLVPQTASKAALELEALGKESLPILKEGLESPYTEVQFYSADALAYLDDSSGVEILARLARDEEAFRVFALAALTNLEGISNEYLRELMNESSAETRYGAFYALHALDKTDPFLAKERIGDQFNLYVLRTKGESMVHLTKHRVPQIVLFGTEQQLEPPFALSAGRHILVTAAAGNDTVTVSRFELGQPDRQKTVSRKLADILRAVGDLGATYPDTAQLLTQAKRNAALPGRLEFDALPQAGRIYHRPEGFPVADGKKAKKSKTQIGRLSMSPNLFPTLDEGNILGDDLDEPWESGEQSKSAQKSEKSEEKSKSPDKPVSSENSVAQAESPSSKTKDRPAPSAASSRKAKSAAGSDQTAEKPAPAAAESSFFSRMFNRDRAPDQSEPDLRETATTEQTSSTADPFDKSP